MRRVFKKALNKSSLKIVNDGRQAISYMEGSGEYHDRRSYPLPYLIFLDLKLPFFHGFTVLAWIRKQDIFDPIRVIILSSSLEDQDREKATSFGALYLVKPPTPELLHEAIRLLGLD